MYNMLPCIMCTPLMAQTFKKKIFHFNILLQFFIYLHLETKPVIIFQGIILHMDIVMLSRVTLNA